MSKPSTYLKTSKLFQKKYFLIENFETGFCSNLELSMNYDNLTKSVGLISHE